MGDPPPTLVLIICAAKRAKALSLFLFPENVVPVILIGFGYRLLTLAHTLLRCGGWLAFGSLRLYFNRLGFSVTFLGVVSLDFLSSDIVPLSFVILRLCSALSSFVM
jgi:hypothetical protein